MVLHLPETSQEYNLAKIHRVTERNKMCIQAAEIIGTTNNENCRNENLTTINSIKTATTTKNDVTVFTNRLAGKGYGLIFGKELWLNFQ